MTQLVVERKSLMETIGVDAEFLNTLIGIFLADCPEKLSAIRAGMVTRERREVVNALHSLKGAVSIFGARRVVDAIQSLESIGPEWKQEELVEGIALLEREMALLTFTLKNIAMEPI